MIRRRTDLCCPDCGGREIDQEGSDLQCFDCGYVWEDEEDYPEGKEEE
jgi:hypothetical protein